MNQSIVSNNKLKKALEKLYLTYDRKYLDTDPLRFAHRYSSGADREIAGLVSAALAYGNVKQIFRSVETVLGNMGESPADFVRSFDHALHLKQFANFRHRFTTGGDVAAMLFLVRRSLEEYGSLENLFMAGYSDEDGNIGPALSRFVSGLLGGDTGPVYTILPAGNVGVRYLLSSPENGSACKRMCMFLRWMVRSDGEYDLGIWKNVSPSRLIIPLDTHTSRICRYIGLTDRKDASWRTAVEVTANLRRFDWDDPVKYDFALSRLGITDQCSHAYDQELCPECSLFQFCLPGGKNVSVTTGVRE